MRSKMVYRRFLSALILLGLLGFHKTSLAIKTTEPYDYGPSVFELHLGCDGLGLESEQVSILAKLLLGYGLNDWLSGYLMFRNYDTEYLVNGQGEAIFGLFGTPIDTNHLDLDLILDISLGGLSFGQLALSPGFEVNLDRKDDLSAYGAYFLFGLNIFGRDLSVEDDPLTESVDESRKILEVTTSADFTLGGYFALSDSKQLLLQYVFGIDPNTSGDAHEFRNGSLELGYNMMLTDSIELINEFFIQLPQGDRSASLGLTTGIFVTFGE